MGSELMLEPSFARQSGPYCDSEYELKPKLQIVLDGNMLIHK
jgi:hypothetical protein